MDIDSVSESAVSLPKKVQNEGDGNSKAKHENDPDETRRIAKGGGSSIHESVVQIKHPGDASEDKSEVVKKKRNSSKNNDADIEQTKKTKELVSNESNEMPSQSTDSSGSFDGLGTLALACAKMEHLKNKRPAELSSEHDSKTIGISSRNKKVKTLNQSITGKSSNNQPSIMSRTVSDSSCDNRQDLPSIHLLNEVVECNSKEGKFITANDVLCGRGGLTNHHPGNVFFRRMVRLRQESYLRACKRDKAGVAHTIVWTIRKLDPPGRFLKRKKDKGGKTSAGIWVEIGDRKAREKTSQALRERAPELMDKLMTSTLSSQVKDLAQNLPSIPEKARFLGLWEQNQTQNITDNKPPPQILSNNEVPESSSENVLPIPIVKENEMEDCPEISNQNVHEMPLVGDHEVKGDQSASKVCEV